MNWQRSIGLDQFSGGFDPIFTFGGSSEFPQILLPDLCDYRGQSDSSLPSAFLHNGSRAQPPGHNDQNHHNRSVTAANW